MSVWDTKNTFLFDCSAAVSYDFDLKILKESDLKIYLMDQLTSEKTPLVLGQDYTITKSRLQDGGNITLREAHPGFNCYGERYIELIQPEEIPTEGYFPEATIEMALDRGILIDQQQQMLLDRVPKLAEYTPFKNFNIENPIDNRMLIFSVDGEKVTIKSGEYNPDTLIDEMHAASDEARKALEQVLEATKYLKEIYNNMIFYELQGSTNIEINNNAGYLFFEKQGSTEISVNEKNTLLFSEKYNNDNVTIELDDSIVEVSL